MDSSVDHPARTVEQLREPKLWEGFAERECDEHQTVGQRAWCFRDNEWCYERAPCRGCELPALRLRVAALEAMLRVAEWVPNVKGGLWCPYCFGGNAAGHTGGCKLSALLGSGPAGEGETE